MMSHATASDESGEDHCVGEDVGVHDIVHDRRGDFGSEDHECDEVEECRPHDGPLR